MNIDALRREFFLQEEDTEDINVRRLSWETIKDGGNHWLLVHDFPIPDGYNVKTATAAILIPLSYPIAALDMVYFNPWLSRIDGKGINAAQCSMLIQGCNYQRWSRHWTPQNPWRAGLDNISSHLSLVEECLLREFRLR